MGKGLQSKIQTGKDPEGPLWRGRWADAWGPEGSSCMPLTRNPWPVAGEREPPPLSSPPQLGQGRALSHQALWA